MQYIDNRYCKAYNIILYVSYIVLAPILLVVHSCVYYVFSANVLIWSIVRRRRFGLIHHTHTHTHVNRDTLYDITEIFGRTSRFLSK